MLDKRVIKPIRLASASPRRKELLQSASIRFLVSPSGVSEEMLRGERAEEAANRLAREKAEKVGAQFPDDLVLGADTVVVLEDGKNEIILGKPEDAADAARMMNTLQGREHTVITGVCILSKRDNYIFQKSVKTRVKFRKLSKDEIDSYVSSDEPFDKAGGYAIQGSAASFVSEIHGSYSNIVGLPLAEVVEELTRIGRNPGDANN